MIISPHQDCPFAHDRTRRVRVAVAARGEASGDVRPGKFQLRDVPRDSTPLRTSARRCRRYAIRATRGEVVVPKVPQLGSRSQVQLIRRAQTGDVEAKRIVWNANARLGYSVIDRRRTRPQAVADFFQEAQLGLSRAIDRFDVDRLVGFPRSASPVMCGWVARHRCEVSFSTTIPVWFLGTFLTFRKAVVQAPTRAAWFDARAIYLDRDRTTYRHLCTLATLAEPLTLEAAAEAPAPVLRPIDELIGHERIKALRAALSRLDARAQLVIGRRYGFDTDRIHTLKEIGEELRLTRERVRQIQLGAEAALHAELARRGWDDELRAPDSGLEGAHESSRG